MSLLGELLNKAINTRSRGKRGRPRKLTPERELAVKEAYQARTPLGKLALEYGCSRQTIQRIVTDAKVRR